MRQLDFFLVIPIINMSAMAILLLDFLGNYMSSLVYVSGGGLWIKGYHIFFFFF